MEMKKEVMMTEFQVEFQVQRGVEIIDTDGTDSEKDLPP